nr:hypothetical protein [Cellulosimicrobium sp. MM]
MLLQPGDVALSHPELPIHIWGPYFAGADARQVPIGDGPTRGYIDRIIEAWELGWPKPRVVVLSFPHNPTTTCDQGGPQRSSTGRGTRTSCSCTTSRTPT